MRRELILLLLTTWPTLAAAEPVERCIQASEQAQEARERGRFAEARKNLEACLDAACPAVIRRDCAEARNDLERRQPTVVIRALDEHGNASNAPVLLDDVPVPSVGREMLVDPGAHVIQLQSAGKSSRRSITVVEGGKAQPFDLRLEPPPTGPTSPAPGVASARRPTLGTWIGTAAFGAIGVAGIATFAIVGLQTNGDYHELEGRCAPDCPEDSTRSLTHRYQVADVALGVGIGALAASALFFAFGPRHAPAVVARGLQLRF